MAKTTKKRSAKSKRTEVTWNSEDVTRREIARMKKRLMELEQRMDDVESLHSQP